MTFHSAEQVLAIGHFDKHTRNESELAIHILDSKLLLKQKTSILPDHLQSLVIILSWTLFSVGSYFKFIIYKYFLEKYRNKSSKPIDILIIVTAIIQHVFTFLSITERTIRHTESWFELYEKSGACVGVRLFVQFGYVYSYIGGFGIALVRILYIRKSAWLEDPLRAKKIMIIILFGGIILGAIWVGLPHMTLTWTKLARDECLLLPQVAAILEEIDDYEKSPGAYWNLSSLQSFRMMVAIWAATMMVITISEISIYVSFFHYMYKHDNNERLARLLEPATIKKRNRQNALTFFGQFCSFAFEFGVGMVLGTAAAVGYGFGGTYILKDVSFTAISVIEVLTSGILRPRIFRWPSK
jgi:hypothetical protein